MPPLARLRPLVPALIAGGVAALTLGTGVAITADPHLDAIPRTAEEAERIARAVALTDDFSAPERFETRPGGAATSMVRADGNAFSHPSANLSFEEEFAFKVGNGLFKKLWVSAPASTEASDGLGPLYNARSCQRCHLKDGRGHPPDGSSAVSMVLALGVMGEDGPEPHPDYGRQLQDFSVLGVPAEGRVAVTWEEAETVALSGGETATLVRPVWRVEEPAHGPLGPEALISARVAPRMIGLGLLEAIPTKTILALADPEDADGDGISGRAQIVRSVAYGTDMLGRFGHKAANPTVLEQSSHAFNTDMGLSTTLHADGAGDCTARQSACRAAPGGGSPEVSDEALDEVVHYSRNLAVPARRDPGDPQVLRGKKVFYAAGCVGCHTPKHVTARLDDRDEHSFQLIWPYTDLLLHDMGPGLADPLAQGRAEGAEWRTAPLWGIGLTEMVNGHTRYLHDGRARDLLEAVLWHGGEAQAAREAVVAMDPADRAALIAFLRSL